LPFLVSFSLPLTQGDRLIGGILKGPLGILLFPMVQKARGDLITAYNLGWGADSTQKLSMTWRLNSGRNLRWVFMTRSFLLPFGAQDPVGYPNTFCPTQGVQSRHFKCYQRILDFVLDINLSLL
jgi:hypothetical protein